MIERLQCNVLKTAKKKKCHRLVGHSLSLGSSFYTPDGKKPPVKPWPGSETSCWLQAWLGVCGSGGSRTASKGPEADDVVEGRGVVVF